MDTPAAEIEIDAALVSALVAEQHPELAGEVRLVSHGWDNDIYRLGPDHAVRIPRREVAVPLLRNEQRWLPLLASRIPVAIPTPVAVGGPGALFPWPWSITRWFGGGTLDRVPVDRRGPIVDQLAAVLLALHVAAPPDAPRNPYRGVDLESRGSYWDDLIPDLGMSAADEEAIRDAFAAGRAADRWPGEPVWLHGDLHPANIVVADGVLSALIDFGDICAGDPASDLAVAWFGFDADDRARLIDRLAADGGYDPAIWTRARAWAAGIGLAILAHSDDAPHLDAIGRHTIAQLSRPE